MCCGCFEHQGFEATTQAQNTCSPIHLKDKLDSIKICFLEWFPKIRLAKL